MCVHIHCKSDYIYVTCTLTITKQCTFYSVSACKNTKLCISNTAASVIMRMKREYNIVSHDEILTHVFDLACVYVRH